MIPVRDVSQPQGSKHRHFVDQPVWTALAWVLLGSLLVWSYGTNNIALPGLPVPVVDLVLGYLIWRSRRWWSPMLGQRWGRRVIYSMLALGVVVLARLFFDYQEHGMRAVRGALFAFEIWGLVVGYAVAQRVGRKEVERRITVIFTLALLWFALYPIRDSVMAISPSVGIYRPVALFAFTSITSCSAWALFWFAARRGLVSILLTSMALGALLMGQSRGTFIGVAVGLLATRIVGMRQDVVNVRRGLAGAVLLSIAVLAVLPPAQGRLGLVTPSALVDLVDIGPSGSGDITSSYTDRMTWIAATTSKIDEQRLGKLVGVGFGEDLTDGFGVTDADVVMPHNDLLEIYARIGLGVIFWMAVWISTAREAIGQAKNGSRIALWYLGSLCVTASISLTQPFASWAFSGMSWWILTGLCLGLACAETTDGQV